MNWLARRSPRFAATGAGSRLRGDAARGPHSPPDPRTTLRKDSRPGRAPGRRTSRGPRRATDVDPAHHAVIATARLPLSATEEIADVKVRHRPSAEPSLAVRRVGAPRAAALQWGHGSDGDRSTFRVRRWRRRW